MYVIPAIIQTFVNFHFSTYIFSADITPDMPKQVRCSFYTSVFYFNLAVFEFSAAAFWRRV